MAITHTVTVTTASGATVDHTAEALAWVPMADGSVAVMAACCGVMGGEQECSACTGNGCHICRNTGKIKLPDTRSWDSFYDVANMAPEDIEARVREHVQVVATRHANHSKAHEHLNTLVSGTPGGAIAG